MYGFSLDMGVGSYKDRITIGNTMGHILTDVANER